MGGNKIIGKSNHSLEQIKKSAVEGADYLSIGPVYETSTKAGRAAVGLDIIERVDKEINIPWLAIGGVDQTTISQMRSKGAKNFAVVRSAREFF